VASAAAAGCAPAASMTTRKIAPVAIRMTDVDIAMFSTRKSDSRRFWTSCSGATPGAQVNWQQ
jgi:hypothetical protein